VAGVNLPLVIPAATDARLAGVTGADEAIEYGLRLAYPLRTRLQLFTLCLVFLGFFLEAGL
jgi:hypothetical protein